MCEDCFVQDHTREWFHWAEKWDGKSFKRLELQNLGLVIPLGHDGDFCPGVSKVTFPDDLSVVDSNGVHKCSVQFCKCHGHESKALQLIRAGIFPATTKKPQTGFTFRCMRDFHAYTLASKGSAYDYIKALDRKTNDPTSKKTFVCPFILLAWR